MGNTRGFILMMTIGLTLLCAVASYAIMEVAVSQAHHGQYYVRRTQARYAIDAATVWTMQQLWQNPAYCGTTQTGSDGMVTKVINGTTVEVTITNCGTDDQKTIAKAIY